MKLKTDSNNILLSKMIVLATNAHAHQFDKSGKPYILHPIQVMQYLQTDDIELMCIALGHDLLEDTHVTTFYLMAEGFTERIINGIIALTKIPGEDYEFYQAAVKDNYDAVLVKLADLKHNTDISRLKGITEKDMERTLKYYKFYLELLKKKKWYEDRETTDTDNWTPFDTDNDRI